MNIKEYGEAVKKIHNPEALRLWVFYKNKGKPLTKDYILNNLSYVDKDNLDSIIEYLNNLGFKVNIL